MSEEGEEITDPKTVSGSGARRTLKALIERETYWRERMGDEDYERALRYWNWLAWTINPSRGSRLGPGGS